jgi:hypothetical protein
MNFDLSNFSLSNPAVIIGVGVVVVLIVVAIAVIVNMQKRKTERLRSRFGSEYDLALRESGSRKRAEEALHGRVQRIEQMKIHELSLVERDRYVAEWETVQSRFIDHPRGAVTEADELVNSLLVSRGYPVGGFDQRAADISVHHSTLVGPYRQANSIAIRASRNEATTEELRTAMIQYRTLFDALLNAKTTIEQQRHVA